VARKLYGTSSEFENPAGLVLEKRPLIPHKQISLKLCKAFKKTINILEYRLFQSLPKRCLWPVHNVLTFPGNELVKTNVGVNLLVRPVFAHIINLCYCPFVYKNIFWINNGQMTKTYEGALNIQMPCLACSKSYNSVMECFIHNMPANEMTLIMEQEE